MDISTLIKVNYSGQLDETFTYTNIGVQAVCVLIGGIILWRVSNVIHAKKMADRANKSQFGERLSDQWRKRN